MAAADRLARRVGVKPADVAANAADPRAEGRTLLRGRSGLLRRRGPQLRQGQGESEDCEHEGESGFHWSLLVLGEGKSSHLYPVRQLPESEPDSPKDEA